MTAKKLLDRTLSPLVCLFAFALVVAGPATLRAQVVPAAHVGSFSLTAGGTGSIFKPDYVPFKLGGIGAYVDVNLFHGLGVEAEGRWQRFHEFAGISQDNYLIGPRYKIRPLWKAKPYVKGLGGFSNMNFGPGVGSGRFTTIAVGGGIDFQLTRKISVRAIDAEYQYWPKFLDSTLSPYGVSAGIGYRIF